MVEIKTVLRSVSDFFDVTEDDLKSKKRSQNLVLPRQIAIYICCDITNAKYDEIAGYMGRRDISTIIYAKNSVAVLMKDDEKIRDMIDELSNMIKTRIIENREGEDNDDTTPEQCRVF